MSENHSHHTPQHASAASTPPTASPVRRRPGWQRAIVLVFVLFFAWHGYATVAWLSGSSTLMKLGPVESYMNPIFRQNWSVFAPNPEDFNTMVQVRAELQGGEQTEWYDITRQDLEDSIQGTPILSRMYQSNFMLALHTLNDSNQITEEEREIVLGATAAIAADALSAEDVRAALTEAGSDPDDGFVERVLNENESLTMIASEVARARWGGGGSDEIAAVQFRIQVIETPGAPWLDERPEAYLFDWEPGWRSPIWHEGINPQDFVERYGPERSNSANLSVAPHSELEIAALAANTEEAAE